MCLFHVTVIMDITVKQYFPGEELRSRWPCERINEDKDDTECE